MKNKLVSASPFRKKISRAKSRLLLVGFIFANTLIAILWTFSNPPAPVAAQGGSEQLTGTHVVATNSAVVNFTQIAAKEQSAPAAPIGQVAVVRHPSGVEDFRSVGNLSAPITKRLAATPSSPSVSSPSPLRTFQALDDIPSVPEGYSWIPPDTHGTVGIDKVMVTHNSNYRILNKADGSVLSTVSMASFWSSVVAGATNKFDPKIAYDPYNNRWILAGVANGASASSAILVGLSQTSDPTGSHNLYSFDADSGNTLWADYPNLGFNKNWVVISVNMYPNAGGAFSQTRILAIDYPTLRAGTFSASYITGISDFAVQPVVTYSSTENTLYMPVHYSSASALYALDTLTGTPSSPVFTYGALKTNSLGGWTLPCSEILPQAPEPFPGTGTRKIESADARIINAVFRNSSIWYAQTIGLPAGGAACNPTRTAAQWVRIDTGGNFVDGGRVDDPSANATNGGKWYAYPSLSVNSLNDVLVGFSQFASNQSPAAGYAFRYSTDSAGTLRDPYIYKAGQGYYEKDFASGRNRWGDFSNTVVDPTNHIDLWTIQEYAATPAGNGNGSGRWGTWWARVSRLNNFMFLPIILR